MVSEAFLDGEVTRSLRIDWVWREAVEARTKTACFGFSTCLGDLFSNRRFVLGFLGFLNDFVS